jgi:quercetin dioxygenase-like cupin family protein
VLGGELKVTLGDEAHRAGEGALASIPQGVSHTFAHAGSGPARFLNVHAPDAGFAEFLRRVSG